MKCRMNGREAAMPCTASCELFGDCVIEYQRSLTECKPRTDQTIKADAGKPQLHRVPTQIVRDIAEVRMYGVGKYGDTDSWRRVELVRYIDAMYRHMLAFIDDPYGCDAESGIPHYKHAACNAAFICELMPEAMRNKKTAPTKRSRKCRTLRVRAATSVEALEKLLQQVGTAAKITEIEKHNCYLLK